MLPFLLDMGKYFPARFEIEQVAKVTLQKVSISLIVLYSTSQKGTSLILLIIFNLFFICITAWFQPYLTDEEFAGAMDYIDEDDSGEIDTEEFLSWLKED